MKSNRISIAHLVNYHFRPALFSCVAAIAMGVAVSADAATLTVTNLNDSGSGSLRQAIADAAPGDTIDFAVTGTITLTSGELVITNDLTISGPGATNLTVSGNNASRVFAISSVPAATISDLTIANGNPGWGGGGISNYLSTLIVINCTVVSNSAPGGVGGGGGGVKNIGGTVTIIGSAIAWNNAGGSGNAGAGILSSGTLNLISSAIFNNVGRQGGGIYFQGFLGMTNSTVSGNSASLFGGGIAAQGQGIIESSTICNNASRGITLVDHQGQVGIRNCIVAGNGASDVAGSAGVLNSFGFNLVRITNGCTITNLTTHNIYGQDPLLGPLADNGGPTATHALLPGSPAIDHGSSGGLATDQRGQPRPFNFPAYFDAADASDIGAVEMQEGPQPGPVFTVNSTNDVDDGVAGIAHCSMREAIAAANANADTNTIEFAAEVPGVQTGVTGTITLTNGQITIANSVNINGPGAANLTVSGNNASRVFFANFTAPVVDISGLRIAHGNGGGGEGAGIYNWSALTLRNCIVTENTNASAGGGIYNRSVLSVIECTISSNKVGGGGGGGIRNNAGTLNMVRSAIHSNSAFVGGGISSSPPGSLNVTNSTITGNIAGSGGGGGIQNSSSAVFDTCTIVFNTAGGTSQGGGLTGSADTKIRHSIVAGNTASAGGPDCSGLLNSLDYNLIQNTNGATITNLTTHNLYNQDPKLGPLADLGGPTPTHALRFDSPVLDAGHSGGLTTDQRGQPRPIDDPNTPNAGGGDGSDIGAYEADPNLRITAIEKAGADIRLRFNTLFGKTYAVESEDHLDNSWIPLTNNIPGTGGAFQALDAGSATLPRRFYRGVLLVP